MTKDVQINKNFLKEIASVIDIHRKILNKVDFNTLGFAKRKAMQLHKTNVDNIYEELKNNGII